MIALSLLLCASGDAFADGTRTWPRIDLAVDVTYAGAPRTKPDRDLFTAGAGMHLWIDVLYFSIGFGAEGVTPSTMSFGPYEARLWRVPLDISARGGIMLGRFDLHANFGAALTIEHIESADLAGSKSRTRLANGFRPAIGLAYWLLDNLAVFVEVESTIIYDHWRLQLGPNDGTGRVATTPTFWLGGVTGFLVRLR